MKICKVTDPILRGVCIELAQKSGFKLAEGEESWTDIHTESVRDPWLFISWNTVGAAMTGSVVHDGGTEVTFDEFVKILAQVPPRPAIPLLFLRPGKGISFGSDGSVNFCSNAQCFYTLTQCEAQVFIKEYLRNFNFPL